MPVSVRAARRILGTRNVPDMEAVTAGVRLARALENLGPAYIELGQVLATRPDLVGDEVALALESLQDRLPPFPTEIATAQVELALGKPITEVFTSFGDSVAATSIAQVPDAETDLAD